MKKVHIVGGALSTYGLLGDQFLNQESATLMRFQPAEAADEPRSVVITRKHTVLLRLAACAVGAIEDLADPALLLLAGVPEEVGPAVLAEQALHMWIVSVDFEEDLSTRLVGNA